MSYQPQRVYGSVQFGCKTPGRRTRTNNNTQHTHKHTAHARTHRHRHRHTHTRAHTYKYTHTQSHRHTHATPTAYCAAHTGIPTHHPPTRAYVCVRVRACVSWRACVRVRVRVRAWCMCVTQVPPHGRPGFRARGRAVCVRAREGPDHRAGSQSLPTGPRAVCGGGG